MDRLAASAPTLVVPGNHDVQWWASPLSIFGSEPKYVKFRQYFGPELTPELREYEERQRAKLAANQKQKK